MFRRTDKHVIHLPFILNAACMASPLEYAPHMTVLREQLMTTDEYFRLGMTNQGIGNSGCLPLCSCMSTAVSIAAVPA
jgi:hypothetical protein